MELSLILTWKGQFYLAINPSPSLFFFFSVLKHTCTLKTTGGVQSGSAWKLLWELHSRIVYIYMAATSTPADQQAIHKHQGGLPVHNYPQQINSNDKRTTHCALSFNSYSLNWPDHQSDTFMLLKYESTGSLSWRQRHLHCAMFNIRHYSIGQTSHYTLSKFYFSICFLYIHAELNICWWRRQRAAVQVDNCSQLPLR